MPTEADLEVQREAELDAEWVGRSHELLSHLHGDIRELVACAIDDRRQRRLAKSKADQLPSAIRSVDCSISTVQRAGAEVVARMPDSERRELVSRLFPGREWAVEPAWRAFERSTVPDGYQSTTFRDPTNPRFRIDRAAWLLRAAEWLGPFRGSLPELARWPSYVTRSDGALSWLLVGAIESGTREGEHVFQALLEQVRGTHAAGDSPEAALLTLLTAERSEGWESVERLLLAAQRQEGLRQAILENVAAGHPDAFRRICRLILEHDLCRFSAVVRAADVWFGLLWDSASQNVVENALTSALQFLDRPSEREAAVTSGPPEQAYFALWAAAFEDISAMVPLAERALASRDPLLRYAGTHIAVQCGSASADALLCRALRDPDLRVAARALARFGYSWSTDEQLSAHRAALADIVFAALEGLLDRVKGKHAKVGPALWPWTKQELKASDISDSMATLVTDRTAERLVPHLKRLSAHGRSQLAGLSLPEGRDWWDTTWPSAGTTPKTISGTTRLMLLRLAEDPSAQVVTSALRALCNRPLLPDELDVHASLLKRKNSEVRTASARRLLQSPDDSLLEFARRMLSGGPEQRAAGLDLLRGLVENKRSAESARRAAAAWAAESRLSSAERKAVESLQDASAVRPRRSDAFGLLNPDRVVRPAIARPLEPLRMSEAAWAALSELAGVILKNKSFELRNEHSASGGDAEPSLLGADVGWRTASPELGRTRAEEWERCPVAELLRPWLKDRAPCTRDADGLELIRAVLACDVFLKTTRNWDYVIAWPKSVVAAAKKQRLDIPSVPSRSVQFMATWAARLGNERDGADALVDGIEGCVAAGLFAAPRDIDDDEGVAEADPMGPLAESASGWLSRLGELHHYGIVVETPAHSARIWRLAASARPLAAQRWQAMTDKEREELCARSAADVGLDPGFDRLLSLVDRGEAGEDDLLDRATHPYWSAMGDARSLLQSPELEEVEDDTDLPPFRRAEGARLRRLRNHPAVRSAARRLRDRIVEIELSRGDAPTEASAMADQVGFAGGADVCVRCLAALGDSALKRNHGYRDESRQTNLTRFVTVTLPGADDTPDRFASLCETAGLSEEALLSLALYAPQWVSHVQRALGRPWEGLEEAVWWLHAHTKDNQYRVNSALRKKWQAAIAERTPLAADELGDGAVDVAWFDRVRKALGPKRWSSVYGLAKFACGGAGHKRAQLFADTMTGAVSESELATRVRTKRHQDAIRALGLAPLKAGAVCRKQVQTRYKLMQEIRRTSRKHGGSMLQASEKRAVEIGMENLARTAGYPDPLRLQWDMERLEIADLIDGPVTVNVADVTVSLSVTPDGAPEISVRRKDKPLASIPPATRKDKRVAELTQRATELRRSATRVRAALEQAMCRGDEFLADELGELMLHPVLRPMLERLVFVTEAGGGAMGYPEKRGKVLRDHAGKLEPLKAADRLRLAHPHDMMARRGWERWQRECFAAERVQPFKQVFRELYLPAETEGPLTATNRYEGQQVNPRQAMALLGGRNWVTRGEEGVQRTFHKERLTARLEFAETFYTPADVEGLTLRSLVFTKAGSLEPLVLKKVPARVFSEAMRDLDLVVSVAHRGGVDPEASHSTVEMRGSLAREACRLLRLRNVRFEGARALIEGTRGEYSVHLGSASVHQLPGGALWIIPVHSQHRGRLFLPFADDDPKTAEVISKILLLARDEEIQDPQILRQLAAG